MIAALARAASCVEPRVENCVADNAATLFEVRPATAVVVSATRRVPLKLAICVFVIADIEALDKPFTCVMVSDASMVSVSPLIAVVVKAASCAELNAESSWTVSSLRFVFVNPRICVVVSAAS